MKHHRPSACPERPDDAVSVFAMGLDPVDLALLALHRHYFRTFADPASQAWMMALAEDDPAFAHLPRGEVARLVLILVQTMRGVRRSAFRFNNPFCPSCALRLTADEIDLCGLWQSSRQSSAELHTRAAILSDGESNPALEIAALRLSEALRPALKTAFH